MEHFSFEIFAQLQCATTNRPMRHAWRMRRRLATPDVGKGRFGLKGNAKKQAESVISKCVGENCPFKFFDIQIFAK